ncbi:MAG: prenyltransferase [Bacterioplanes sp.]|nr:prenyltransferase [Bacterioplanes sp.]
MTSSVVSARALVQSSRVPFLLLPPMCVLLGLATAWHGSPQPDAQVLAWVLVGALLAHISVNLLNEYLDFRSGLDLLTQRTPFSGGSGSLPEQPNAARVVLWGGVVTLLATAAVGLYLTFLSGWWLLPIGVLGLLLVAFYTQPINRMPWLCLISPGLGFGVLMVLGTHYALAASVNALVIVASLVPFFMVNNLLLLNQFPDVRADEQVGRRHLAIASGMAVATRVYLVMTLCVPALLLLGIAFNVWSVWILLALLPWSLTLISWRAAQQWGEDIGQHPQAMAMNVMATLLTPLVMALVIMLLPS